MVDPLCDQVIGDTIHAAFPRHVILGEGGVEPGIAASRQALEEALAKTIDGGGGENESNDGWLWIVDPIVMVRPTLHRESRYACPL